MDTDTQGANGAAEDRKIIGAKVPIQIGLCLPFTDEQRRVLIDGVDVDVKCHATLGGLDGVEQLFDRLQKLFLLLRLHCDSC